MNKMQFYQIKKGQMVIQQLMHINLNNPTENFLELSPMLGGRDQRAPSPLLSPDPLFLAPPENEDINHFHLQDQHDSLRSNFIGQAIDHLSSPLRYHQQFEPIDRLEDPSDSNDDKVPEREPTVRRRKEHRASKLVEMRTEELPPIKLPDGDLPSIRKIIQFLVQNSAQPEQELLEKGASLWGEGQDLSMVLGSLIGKFKKLRKTKQEMTKYCMRKVFKFIADRMKKDRTHNRDVDSCMKLYFSKSQNGSNSFSIPFKKNSIEKTMNGNFLKRVFASQTFVRDYRDFLRQFQALMMEDNEKKVLYLADVLEKYIQTNDLKKIENIKRLPWSREILSQTEQLAVSLLGYAEAGTRREEVKDQ